MTPCRPLPRRPRPRPVRITRPGASRFADAGILRQISVGKRNRAFESAEIIDAFTSILDDPEPGVVEEIDDTDDF
jgi:hypothetical protein